MTKILYRSHRAKPKAAPHIRALVIGLMICIIVISLIVWVSRYN